MFGSNIFYTKTQQGAMSGGIPGATTLKMMTLALKTFSIMALRIAIKYTRLSMTIRQLEIDIQHNESQHSVLLC
jgi:hypothetical protein